MSEALTVLGQDRSLQLGGLGLDSQLFQLRPSILELVSKTSRQENVIHGQFRDISTNEHWPEMKLVLLFPPKPQREYYEKGTNTYSKEMKLCFSLDTVQPHRSARKVPALYCSSCPMGDINWEKWRKTRKPEDLPPCRKYWHLLVADRRTQMPYYLNVKGTSITPFEQGMQNVTRLINMMKLNAEAANKQIAASNAAALAEYKHKLLELAEGTTLAEPVLQTLQPMPNVFDISFTVYGTQLEKGGPFTIGFKDFGAVKEEDRAAFGQMYLNFVNNARNVRTQMEAEAEAAEQEKNTAATQPAPDAPPVVESPIPTGAITGEVVPDSVAVPAPKSNLSI